MIRMCAVLGIRRRDGSPQKGVIRAAVLISGLLRHSRAPSAPVGSQLEVNVVEGMSDAEEGNGIASGHAGRGKFQT